MIDLENSYCFIGNNEDIKKKAMETLSKKLNIPILDVKKLMFLQKAGAPKMTQEEKDLRAKYPNLPNLYDLGFDAEMNAKIIQKYGNAGQQFYQKQFEMKFLEALTSQLEGKVILSTPMDFSVVLESQANILTQLSQDPELKGAIVNPNFSHSELQNAIKSKFGHIIATNNPKGLQVKEENQKFESSMYSAIATHELKAELYYDAENNLKQGTIEDPTLNTIIEEGKKKAAQPKAEQPKNESQEDNSYEEEPKKPSFFSKLAKGFGKFLGGVLNVATLGVFGLIKKAVKKSNSYSTDEVFSSNDHPDLPQDEEENTKGGQDAPEQGDSAPEQGDNAPEQSDDAPEQSDDAPEQSDDAPEQDSSGSDNERKSTTTKKPKEPTKGDEDGYQPGL